ncbi:hypothetical protein NA57DRAFT_61132 [Rhizodiscina lignyota]|uniref:FAD-binding PCMH-type domain-containing protein n=1 Tax=Rhizodiscina lignyota TaxID=1504668 RepID=A0A9P4I8W8_9PEZI|nr:hypothetical protein NA57DRAFT_61132 [Rhizodiscina lignyota]
MALPSRSWDLQVDDRISLIANKLGEDTEFSRKEVPGLKPLLDDYINPDVEVDSVDWRRRMLQVFKDSETDNTYQDLLAKHSPDEQQRIERFVAGEDPAKVSDGFVMGPSMGFREELAKLHEAPSIVHVSRHGATVVKGELVPTDDDWFHRCVRKIAAHFGIHMEETGHKGEVLIYKDAEFQNWGLSIENIPRFTCICKSALDIQTIVSFAKENDMSVRCSGYRHSWAPIFGKTGEILISMLDLKTATELPNTASLPQHDSPPTELEMIEVVPGEPTLYTDPKGALVRVGCATTNERLRKWCIQHNKLTIPFNVIMVELTLGGSNAPICHGAGRRHQTLSDLVRKIEYVDANGKIQAVDKPEHLRAASGCFGLLGVVTHVTMEFPPMTYAELAPQKMPVICAVPPPPDLDEKDIPLALLKYWKNLTPEQKQKYQDDFERRATQDYYSEWFWFPYSDFSWVNTWNDTKDSSGVQSFPDDCHIFLSFIGTVLMNCIQFAPVCNKLDFSTCFAESSTTLLSRTAMGALPEKAMKTYLPDALHFQRAVQNIRVRDMEVEMPLVAKASGGKDNIDYTPVQRAWWDAILLTYKHNDTCPMRMPLEMRMMGGSDVILAPQRGNKLGTCAIEVLTLHNAGDIWPAFVQEIIDKWMALKNPTTGERLRTRPHWAKEWYDFKVDGKPWVDRLKNEDYKNEIAEFLGVLEDIGKDAGWTLKDLKARFSNDYFDKVFFDQVGK